MTRTRALSISFSECSLGLASIAQFGIGTVLKVLSSKAVLGGVDKALMIGAIFLVLEAEGSISVGS